MRLRRLRINTAAVLIMATATLCRAQSPNPPERIDVTLTGSEQEFDGDCILGRFLEYHEFGSGHGHALGLQQEVAKVFVAASAAQQ